MIRTLSALVLAASVAFSGVAEAATKDEIKEQKTHVKELSKELKTLKKLTAKWEKGREKGKDTAKLDDELKMMAKDELKWLRKKGQPTKQKEMEEGETEENPWMARFRDACVGVRDGGKTVEMKGHLEQMQNSMQTRLDRQTKKLEKMEG